MARRKDIRADIERFERMEAIKPSMKCASYEEIFSMETDDPIQAQVEAFKQRTARGQCDHIDITEVFRSPKDPSRIAVKYRCCRLRK